MRKIAPLNPSAIQAGGQVRRSDHEDTDRRGTQHQVLDNQALFTQLSPPLLRT